MQRTVRITKEIEINTTLSDLWDIISTPSNLEYCHPFCKKNPIIQWPGSEAKDKIEYYNGLVLYREFNFWEQEVGYDLTITRSQVDYAQVQWRITSLSKEHSKLQIDIQLTPQSAFPSYNKWMASLITTIYFKPKMSHYLQSVVQGFKYYAETRQKVKKNQFGYNPLFSSKK